MFSRFEITVGLRYLKAKQKNSFVSFISLVSIIGIALGVAALITVLSVMNGFQKEIRGKIIGVTAHMQIADASGMLANWLSIATKTKHLSAQVLAYAPYVDGQALVSFEGSVSGILVRGIEPKFEQGVEDIGSHVVKGNSDSLTPGKFNVIIGADLARQLGVAV
ncbi:MAG: ABC transporter permease, partial [Burkholderiales bacterium]